MKFNDEENSETLLWIIGGFVGMWCDGSFIHSKLYWQLDSYRIQLRFSVGILLRIQYLFHKDFEAFTKIFNSQSYCNLENMWKLFRFLIKLRAWRHLRTFPLLLIIITIKRNML